MDFTINMTTTEFIIVNIVIPVIAISFNIIKRYADYRNKYMEKFYIDSKGQKPK